MTNHLPHSPAPAPSSPASIPLAKISHDGATQVRAAIDQAVVDRYCEAMREGAIFPAVTVFMDTEGEHWLSDGRHRVAAAKAAGRKHIDADVRLGSRRDAILHACGANSTHGHARSGADKRRAVEVLLDDPEWCQWSNREIGRRADVSESFVRQVKGDRENVTAHETQSKTTYVTKHGTTATMDTRHIGKEPRSAEVKAILKAEAEAIRALMRQEDERRAAMRQAVAQVKAILTPEQFDRWRQAEGIEDKDMMSIGDEDAAMADAG